MDNDLNDALDARMYSVKECRELWDAPLPKVPSEPAKKTWKWPDKILLALDALRVRVGLGVGEDARGTRSGRSKASCWT